ncbi:MAG TPA: hypothetical protein VEJ63_01820 [Planctomycetota bacterium]|nr:hypothetical protein [Planctomycetota bacterium]
MPTQVQYFQKSTRLTTPLTGDPLLAVIENSPTTFGAVLADACQQDSWSDRLYLENVTWFRATRKQFAFTTLSEAAFCTVDGYSAVYHNASRSYLPNFSQIPHRVLFISWDECHLLKANLQAGYGKIFFESVQQHFGGLPGFRAIENEFTTPDGYADVTPHRPLEMKTA